MQYDGENNTYKATVKRILTRMIKVQDQERACEHGIDNGKQLLTSLQTCAQQLGHIRLRTRLFIPREMHRILPVYAFRSCLIRNHSRQGCSKPCWSGAHPVCRNRQLQECRKSHEWHIDRRGFGNLPCR